MKLAGLLENHTYEIIQGTLNVNIKSIHHDSRCVDEGALFICIEGYESDGHQYIHSAIKQGAVAIIVTKEITIEDPDILIVKVKDARETLAHLATRYYNRPTSQFGLIGVTGTNGKTSTVNLIERILRYSNKKTGLIGTIENKIDDLVIPTEHTTPDALELQQLFAKMVEANVNDVVMEVSSHALDLKRVWGAEFDIAVFTNLTLDHLDYHKTMEAYRDAKLKLFMMADDAVINIDDPVGAYIIENTTSERLLTYSCLNHEADLYAGDIHIDIRGTHFLLNYEGKTYKVDIQTPGRFSVYNALAAIGATLLRGVEIEKIVEALGKDSIIEGRFEVIKSESGYYAIVDYAHAPDGLENVLKTIQEFAKGRVITVFGCGGDRDKSKRPIMGRIAASYSDYTVITSDNPRTENPQTIMDEVEVGVIPLKKPYVRIENRIDAIKHGLDSAQKDDIVLVAGKGHEDYQIIGKTKIHMDDKEIIRSHIQEA
ncbi:UDP-N-acetylmuramoylalanyl-D-glutamate-2, 6-diaminopimelate ligase [Petrocella atlantisensis]|uniref:UDP-N-acetylmuramoyl-L-alanyl-D-glutamate--2,6-diaminopimelate ligase n=1 Tax=Petrocella atlantisensis TaxID=2173034 RepID=A0A3P7P7Z8_9FIRM|nr:UDP-N-acetylmuramoyl-L-alanyl-D-glutamate--2,6-diaminopimelate ligase [Petrocella atlantisensis]VDN46343.1 UDP-N-acetylmuramoylalanyl-D-glutamate-2, 6-diaminopimelate ligase [Petrocella atlantisensis]